MILITGGNGQLAKEFQRFFTRKKIKFSAPSKEILNITNYENTEEFIKDKNIELIINCAAYNFVDKAEEESELAYKVNAYGVENLGKICKNLDIPFVTYSTDFVFDGKK